MPMATNSMPAISADSKSNSNSFGDKIKNIKILLIGDAQVGKSRVIARFLDKTFNDESTIGVDFFSKSIQIDDESIQVQFWDTAGKREYRSLISSYFKGAQGVILVFDANEGRTYDNLESWYNTIKKFCDMEKVPVLLLANKMDLVNIETPSKFEDKKEEIVHREIADDVIDDINSEIADLDIEKDQDEGIKLESETEATKSDQKESIGKSNSSIFTKYSQFAAEKGSTYAECSAIDKNTTSINDAFYELFHQTISRVDFSTSNMSRSYNSRDSDSPKSKKSKACTIL